MASSETNVHLLLFLTLASLLQAALSQNQPLLTSCSSENYTVYSSFEANLKKVLAFLNHQTPGTGVGLASVPNDPHNPDQAHGLALCGGDVSTPDCKTCIAEASSYIRKSCPNGKQAMVWYDECGLKYSDKKFFGQIDNGSKVYMWNTQNVSDPNYFNQKVKEMLSKLGEEASVASKMYAAGELEVGGYAKEKVYGAVQCTRDLSSADCKKCVDDIIISDLPSCCDGKRGGRVVTGSCTIRYETNPFVKV